MGDAPMDIEFSPGTLFCTAILCVIAIIIAIRMNKEK